MKLYDGGIAILIAICLVIGGVGFVSSKKLGDDNPIEEVCEDVLEKITGLEIDLTPSTPELPQNAKDSPRDIYGSEMPDTSDDDYVHRVLELGESIPV